MTTPKLFWLFSLAVLMIQAALAFPDLPDQMVTHMNLQGVPDGYGSKDEFFLAFGMAALVINIMPPLLPLLLRRLPDSMVNLPNKEYWYADAPRKASAIDRMFSMMALTMGMINVMFILIFQQISDLSVGKLSTIPQWVVWCIIPFLIIVPPLFLFIVFRVQGKQAR